MRGEASEGTGVADDARWRARVSGFRGRRAKLRSCAVSPFKALDVQSCKAAKLPSAVSLPLRQSCCCVSRRARNRPSVPRRLAGIPVTARARLQRRSSTQNGSKIKPLTRALS